MFFPLNNYINITMGKCVSYMTQKMIGYIINTFTFGYIC